MQCGPQHGRVTATSRNTKLLLASAWRAPARLSSSLLRFVPALFPHSAISRGSVDVIGWYGSGELGELR